MTTEIKTFLGRRVWPAPFLKLYFPFFLSGSTIFFLFSFAHTKMMDNPQDKWLNIVANVKQATADQVHKNAASAYLEEHGKAH
jgi:hypothetical protein